MSKVHLQHFTPVTPTLSRRAVLKSLSTLGLAPLLNACVDSSSPASGAAPGVDESQQPPSSFKHGVASGDPYARSVLLWTRVTPERDADITVHWLIAADPELTEVVDSGSFTTNAGRDYTVKVVAEGLKPQTHYWYQFRAGDATSAVGRTKTAPTADAALEQILFAFTSCAYYSMGFFNAYHGVAQRDDLDVVLALVDYIYEDGGDEPLATPFAFGRYMEPAHEIVSLEDYRIRHALYKTDSDLQAAHAAHPWICTWDDHESANNSYTTGAADHTEGEEGNWTDRKRAAIRAYFEWMPVRDEFNPNDRDLHLYRRIRYGDLLEFFVLDTRLEGRDPQAADSDEAAQPGRHMISPAQENWLLDGLRSTPVRWKIIAQQTMLSQLFVSPGNPFSFDSWDGYVDQRNRLLDAFAGDDINNVVVITGDIHTAFCCELTKDPTDRDAYTPESQGAVGVEFVCPSITTQGLPPVVAEAMRLSNRHIRYAEGALETGHGYVVVTATPERCEGQWMYSLSVLTQIKQEREGAVWGVNDGETRLTRG